MSDATPPPGPQPGYQPPAPPTPLSDSDQRLWSTLTHLGWIAGSFIGLPFLPALVAYLVFKERGGYVRQHTAAALNFQISWLLWGIAIVILSIVTLGLGLLLIFPFAVAYIVFTVVDAVHANKGEAPSSFLSLSLVR